MRIPAAGLVLASLVGLLAPACATYQEELARGESAFQASEDDRALAIFRGLEHDQDRLSDPERAHYAYLRGMTDYRIGYKAEARHWLAVAAALEQQTPGSLPGDWAKRMTDTLKELNEDVFTGGIESLSNQAVAKAKDDDSTAAPKEAPADRDSPTRASKPPKDDE
ncbi:MAG: hypothetical protein ACRELB_10835 [Polyangiaceae bacterium]